jgi:hypothetical protein
VLIAANVENVGYQHTAFEGRLKFGIGNGFVAAVVIEEEGQ